MQGKTTYSTLYVTFFVKDQFSKFLNVLNGILEISIIIFVELLMSTKGYWRNV